MTSHSLVVLSAGLRQPSSTRLLADQLAIAVQESPAGRSLGIEVETIELRESAHAVVDNLLLGYPSPSLEEVIEKVTRASALIVASPVFAASVSGLFKSFFDVLDKDALVGKPVLIAATGGTARHAQVLDHVMRPIFTYLRTNTIRTAVFAAPEDWGGDVSGGLLSDRIQRAAAELAAEMERSEPAQRDGAGTQLSPFSALLANSAR